MIAIIIVFVTGLLVMLSGLWKQRDISKPISLLGLGLAFVSILLKKEFALDFSQFYVWNPLAIMMTALSLFIAFFLILNYDATSKPENNSSVLSMLLFSFSGALLLFGYTHLLTLFLGLEILSIPLYVLAASDKNNRLSLEAGLKYFILGSFGSAFLLFGIALLYGTYGGFGIERVIQVQQMGIAFPPYYYVGMLMVLVAIFFKMALAPFHFWSPDVYEGSPTIITGYMSTIVKIAASIAMYYLLNGFFAASAKSWLPIVIIISCLSFLISGLMGIVQHNVKRLLAYSSISHASFILLAILIALVEEKSKSTVTFYLYTYAISGLLVFTILNAIKSKDNLELDSLNGLVSHHKLAAIGLTIGLLSMAGIPLTGGFIAKWNVLSRIYPLNLFSFVMALLASALGIVYYLKTINRVCFYTQKDKTTSEWNSSWTLNLTIVICIILILVLGILPGESFEMILGLF